MSLVIHRSSLVIPFCVFLAIPAYSGSEPCDSQTRLASEASTVGRTRDEVQKQCEMNRDFLGFNWAPGLIMTYDTGTRDRVEEAVVDDAGIVRVNKKNNVSTGVVLEAHYYFGRHDTDWRKLKNSGFGPFVAVRLGSDNIVEGEGLGFMFGWRHGTRFNQNKAFQVSSFNLGVGFFVEPHVKVLGDEFKENQSAPQDPTGRPLPIRYQTRDQGAIMIVFTASF